jgi:hypothetical protein
MPMPKHRHLLRALTAALAISSTGTAWAGRPLQTEDAGVLGAGECEIESFAARERVRDEPTARALSAQVGCGIGLRSQLALAAARTRAAGEKVDDITLVGKTWLRELDDDDIGVTLAYALGATRLPGASLRHEATEVRAVVTVPRGDWQVHANAGWARSEADRLNSTIWGMAAERTGLGPVDLMAEVFGDDRSDPWLNAGLRWNAIPDRLNLDASYGVQMNSARARLLTVGFKLTF